MNPYLPVNLATFEQFYFCSRMARHLSTNNSKTKNLKYDFYPFQHLRIFHLKKATSEERGRGRGGSAYS